MLAAGNYYREPEGDKHDPFESPLFCLVAI